MANTAASFKRDEYNAVAKGRDTSFYHQTSYAFRLAAKVVARELKGVN